MRNLTILFLGAFLAACAVPQTQTPKVTPVDTEIEEKKQRELAMGALVETEKRLYTVGYPLLTHGTPLCGDKVSPSIGMLVWNKHRFKEEWQEAIASKYGVTDLVQVAHVSPGSPADRAGIKVGDLPVSINGWLVPTGEDSLEEFWENLNERKLESDPIEFIMRRGDSDITASVIPEPACDFELVLDDKDTKNAYADGKRIVVHRGLMEFFKTDQEVALIIAHELAHNAMGHVEAKQINAIVGGLIGLMADVASAAGGVNTQGQFTDLGAKAGAGAYSVDFEKEADYVGLYLMALAGYEIEGVADFWRRMAVQDPKVIRLRGTHPTTPERFVGIEKAVSEIQRKIAGGLALRPENKRVVVGEKR